MRLTSLRAATGPVLALTAERMAVRPACGAAACPPAALHATAAMRHGAPPVYCQHSTVHAFKRRYNSWHPRPSQHPCAGTGWWRMQPQVWPQVRCMAAQREQPEEDSPGSNGSEPAAENGSEQPSPNRESDTQPEVGRGSLAPGLEKTRPSDAEQNSMTYREMLAEWFYTRETDLRSLAAEGRLQLRNFLADPSITVLGRDVSFASWVRMGQDFDLKEFTGSFSRVADFSAWYPSGKAVEDAAADEDAKGSIQEVDGRHPAAIAFEKGGPSAIGFGFSAGGLLFSYYIGVIFGLHDLGIVTRDTKLAGASAGSLIAACYHSGLPEDVVTKACFTLAKDCRENGTRGRLGSVLVRFLEELLPDDIHERCRDKAYVAVTRVFPRPTPELISDFQSKDDLIAALLTSCHIPWWFDKRVWTSFRGQASYDGGLTNFIPLPPVEHGVRVCCFASKQITSVVDIQISPDNFVEFEHGIQQMVAWAFEPADDQKLNWFIEKGRADAKAWAEATGVLALVSPEDQRKEEGVQRASMAENAAEEAAAPAA